MERKEAIEIVRKLYNESLFMKKDKEAMVTLIPELAESEDERIRKALINVFSTHQGYEVFFGASVEDILAWLEKQGEPKEKPTKEQVWDYCSKISSEWWQITMDKWNTLADEDKNKYNQFIGFNDFSDTLMNITAGALFQLIDTGKLEYEEGSLLLEKPDDTPKPLEVMDAMNEKQGEQKPDDKVEPKFKVGDWCIDNEDGTIFQIVKVLDNTYIYKTNEGKEYSCSHYSLEIDAKLWTIQDAKDGDILMANAPFIFNGNLEGGIGCPGAHCGINTLGEFQIPKYQEHWTGHATTPATKEQYALLFQKMKEAGYEWDAEKKELNKIEKNPACSEEEKQLLLKDLCARLPYGVKAKITEVGVLSYDNGSGIGVIVGKENVDNEVFILQGKNDSYCLTAISEFVPYLRPMSSMTEEELNECVCQSGIKDIECPNWQDIPKEKQFGARLNHAIAVFLTDSNNVDWLNAHHFDYRGMIEKGLALPAKDGMYSPPIWAFVPTGGR